MHTQKSWNYVEYIKYLYSAEGSSILDRWICPDIHPPYYQQELAGQAKCVGKKRQILLCIGRNVLNVKHALTISTTIIAKTPNPQKQAKCCARRRRRCCTERRDGVRTAKRVWEDDWYPNSDLSSPVQSVAMQYVQWSAVLGTNSRFSCLWRKHYDLDFSFSPPMRSMSIEWNRSLLSFS